VWDVGTLGEPRDAEAGLWWAAGDLPARDGCGVQPLVDGRAAMLALCRAFLSARQYILLAGWDLEADLPLVRGGDARLGDDDTPQQRDLIASLRREGLDDDALALWTAGRLRVVDVLGFAAQRGVRVGVLLWDAYHFGSHVTNDPAAQRAALTAVGVDCLLDDSSRRITHIVQSLHQKCAVVDGRVAFVGGVDLTVQYGGDYDRWDTHQHPCASAERTASRSAAAHPWHDVHTRISGPIVADVLTNIVQRWTEVAGRHNGPTWPGSIPSSAPAPLPGGAPAQIVRTIPPNTYSFAPQGIATIKEAYLRALAQARVYVYLENQYLWPEIFVGFDALRWGERSPDSMEVLDAIGHALARGVRVALTLPDHPNCGRRFTDGGVAHLRAAAAAANATDRLDVFTLGSAEADETNPAGMLYRPVYAHAKVAVVDDLWWTAGSANLNSRGMRSDAEINVAVLDPAAARQLRMTLWDEHLTATDEQRRDLLDPLGGLEVLRRTAQENVARVQRRLPLVGHVLPYLTEDDGRRLGIPVHHEHGWLDALAGGAGAMPAHHAGRYL
jgi:phosphatidylserine/phosphatidylglycerophosphate/cardiolipin synthase-like enzyme